MTHRASAIAYGQMGKCVDAQLRYCTLWLSHLWIAAYGAALDHFDLCEKSDDRLGGEEGRDCADKLEVTRQRQQAGPVAMIAELSSRVFGEFSYETLMLCLVEWSNGLLCHPNPFVCLLLAISS